MAKGLPVDCYNRSIYSLDPPRSPHPKLIEMVHQRKLAVSASHKKEERLAPEFSPGERARPEDPLQGIVGAALIQLNGR